MKGACFQELTVYAKTMRRVTKYMTTYHNVYSWSEKHEWEAEYVTEMKLSCSCPVSRTRATHFESH